MVIKLYVLFVCFYKTVAGMNKIIIVQSVTNAFYYVYCQARMKLPKKRRRVVAVEAPRRVRRPGQPGGGGGGGGPGGGSIGGNGGSGNGPGLHRRVNAIKGGHHHHNHIGSVHSAGSGSITSAGGGGGGGPGGPAAARAAAGGGGGEGGMGPLPAAAAKMLGKKQYIEYSHYYTSTLLGWLIIKTFF